MLQIEKFVCNMIQENCYVVSDETKECVIIDCGAFYPEERKSLVSYIRDNGLTLTHLLATHGHLDHNFGIDTIYNEFGTKLEINAADEFLVATINEQSEEFLGVNPHINVPPIGPCISGGDTVSFGSHNFSVIPTPGHSPGGVVFYCKEEQVAFSGDTLFRMSIGRTDFPYSNWAHMQQSLNLLSTTLAPPTTVWPGHGPSTLMADEMSMNPYLRR